MGIRLSDRLSLRYSSKVPVDLPVNSYDEYAIKAFQETASTILLKPIEESDQKQPCASSSATVPLRTAAPEYRQLELGYLAANKKNRFLVQVGDTFRYVETPDVAFFL